MVSNPRKSLQNLCRFYSVAGAFFLSLLAIFSCAETIWAAPRTGIQVSPLLVEKEVYRGEEITFAVKFFNPLGKVQKIRPKFKDFVASGSGTSQQIKFLDYSSPRYTVSRWADFPKKTLELGPYESQVVEVKIRVPERASMGSHFGAFFGEIRGDDTNLVPGPYYIKQHVAAGTLVFISVVQEGLENSAWSGKISDFKVQGKDLGGIYLSAEPLSFKALFENSGIFHQNVWGAVSVTNLLGKKEKSLRLREKKVLPGNAVDYWDRFSPRLPFGRYKAEAKVFYGRQGEKEADKEVSFWVFDPRLGWLPAIVAVVLIARGAFGKMNNK